jgi:hypothetical protein
MLFYLQKLDLYSIDNSTNNYILLTNGSNSELDVFISPSENDVDMEFIL